MSDARFHPAHTRETGEKSFTRGLKEGYLTDDDVYLMKAWTSEMRSTHQISDVRVLKYYTTLCGIKRALPEVPIRTWTTIDIHNIIETLKTQPNTKGRNYSQNSLHDHIVFLKRFILWLVENEIISIPIKKIKDIKPPAVRYDTTHADELFTDDELMQIISGAKNPRDIALIYVLYESGARASEVARLRWRDAVFDQYGVKLYLDDRKNETKRYIRLTMATAPLSQWRNAYPGIPEGDNPIFITNRNETLSYPNMVRVLRESAKRGGLEKKIKPHLFRKTRITDMIRQNFQESAIKESIWGNVSTDQFKTYLRLKETDIDREFLRHAGIDLDDTELGEAPVLKPVTCSRCHYTNPPSSHFCSKCGLALTEDAALEITKLQALASKETLQMTEEKMRELILMMKEEGEI